jgi:hypothetical protein
VCVRSVTVLLVFLCNWIGCMIRKKFFFYQTVLNRLVCTGVKFFLLWPMKLLDLVGGGFVCIK